MLTNTNTKHLAGWGRESLMPGYNKNLLQPTNKSKTKQNKKLRMKFGEVTLKSSVGREKHYSVKQENRHYCRASGDPMTK